MLVKRRTKKAPAPVPSAVPDYVQLSSVYQRKKVTKRKLPSFVEAMMLLHAPEVQRLFWKALMNGLTTGDKDFVRMAGEIFDVIKRGPGISVTQQIMQQNVAASVDSPVIGFDALTRQLAEARSGHALSAPVIDVQKVHPVDSSMEGQ